MHVYIYILYLLILFPFRRNIEHHLPIPLGGVPCLCFQGCAFSRFELSLVKWRPDSWNIHPPSIIFWDTLIVTETVLYISLNTKGANFVTSPNPSSETVANAGWLELGIPPPPPFRVPRLWTPWKKLHRGWWFVGGSLAHPIRLDGTRCWFVLHVGWQRLFFFVFFEGET